MRPIPGATTGNCDFGTPVATGTPTVTSPGPVQTFNMSAMTPTNVTITDKRRCHEAREEGHSRAAWSADARERNGKYGSGRT
uniref:Uncharacterized protein n=1 Tax=Burkholderia cenocepacia TaxID=95486 RepID=A0A071MEQ5_9BURK